MNHLKIECVSELVTSESLKLAIRSAGILQQKKITTCYNFANIKLTSTF